ncbi:MAG TPA: hypothetical protein VMV53_03375 [Acidimicrobiales bacterium]|nr:hypothetical protein [Acidimicrobiales bacterium]
MITADTAYAIGMISVPVVIAVLAVIWYARRGWPRSFVKTGLLNEPGSSWRRWVRYALSAVLGFYIFGQTAYFTLSHTGHSAAYNWVINTALYADRVGNDLTSLKTAETAHSLVGVNNACSNGVTDVQVLASKPMAPDAHLETLYNKWLVDAFYMFSYCQNASSNLAQYQSAAGVTDWNKAMSYALKADSMHREMVTYGSTLN